MSDWDAAAERSDFEYKVDCRPDYSFLTVKMPPGKPLTVESSAMATMSTNLDMSTSASGGFSRLLTGESLFINRFEAIGSEGEIGIAPPAPGDLDHMYLDGETVFLQNSAFVAAGPDVKLDSQWNGARGFFSGTGLFLIRCSGTGDLWFNSYGAITRIDVEKNYVVDTGFIVAFTSGLNYNVSTLGGFKSLFFSGEGLVCRFSGQGRIWMQTRQVPALAAWIHPFRPKKSDND